MALPIVPATAPSACSSIGSKAAGRALSATMIPTSCPSAMAGTTSRLSTPDSPGIRTSCPGRTPPTSSKPRRMASEYFAICRRFPSRTGWQRAAAAPIGPAPTTTSAPTLSASKPRLAMAYRRRPVSSSSRRCTWRYPSSSTRPSRVVSTSTSRSSQRPMRAISSAEAASRAAAEPGPATSTGRLVVVLLARPRVTSVTSTDAEDRRRPQPEDVLHPRVRGDGVDVGAQPLEHVPASLGPLVHQRQPVLPRR